MNTLYETMADSRRGLSVNDANATLGGGLRAASIVSGSRATGMVARGVPALALAAALFAAALALPGGDAWGAQCTAKNRQGAGTTTDPYTDGQVICGDNASATPDFAVAIGESATAGGISAIAIGKDAQATAENATAIGHGAKASGKQSVAIGVVAKAEADNAIATGDNATASAQSSIAIGNKAKSEAQSAISMGTNSNSSAAGAIAIGGDGDGGGGTGAAASAAAGVALGGSGDIGGKVGVAKAAQVTIARGAALGAGSKATRQAGAVTGVTGYDILTNTNALLSSVSEPAEVWRSTAPEFAVGDTTDSDKAKWVTRNIINMAAGSEDTDGVNVAQLKQLQEAIADHHFYISANGKRSGVYGEDTVTFVGDDNIFVDLNGQTISVQLNPNLTADSVTINDGGPVMNEGGINMSNRPITNVADGRNPHDAVNRGQLDGMDGRLRAGIAGAVAQANIPQVMTPGAYMLGAGLGHSKNRLALGVGWSARSDNGRWVLRNSVGLHDDATSFGAGVGYEF